MKKAQAALEFLTTYGWAFLVILVMISALAYFGILKPSKLLPDRCSFGTEFECQDYMLDATGDTFKLRLKNNVGEVIDVSVITLGSETQTQFACTGPTNPTSWASGGVKDLTWTSCNYGATGMVAGDKGKVLVTLTYHTVKSGSSYLHDVQGEVYSTVK